MKKYLLTAVAFATALDAHAQTKLSLTGLEEMTLSSPAVRAAAADLEAAEAKHSLAVSDMSPKLFASGTAASTKDSSRPERYVVETLQPSGAVSRSETTLTAQQDRYARYGAVVGIRIPLFGSRTALMRNAQAAESSIALAKAREQVAQMETLKGLRYAYVETYYRRAQAKLAQIYADGEADTTKVLDTRKNARLILNADYKALQSAFYTARNDVTAANAAAEDSAEKIRILTGIADTNLEVAPPALPVACKLFADEKEDDTDALHPALRMQVASLEEKRRALSLAGPTFMESGLTISQGINRLEDGRTGASTAISLDVVIPIGGPDRDAAAKKLALAEVQKAEIEFDQQKLQYLAAIEKVKREVNVRQDQIAMLDQRLDASKEAERVARLRIAQPEGEAVERLLRSKHALYQAYHAQLEAELMLAKARIDMMGLGNCDGPKEVRPDLVVQAEPVFTQALLPPSSMGFSTASLQNTRGGKQYVANDDKRNVPVLGWYAWHTLNKFEPAKANAFWAKLPKTDRVLLSLNATQIEAVNARTSERKRLNAFLDSAKKRGIEVGLLLGDPGWVQPGESKKLIKIVESLSKFPFSSIHLDIEESQVPEEMKGAWAPGLVSLVKELKTKTSLPIAVSLHPRDVNVKGLLAGLKDAGAVEVALMQYSTNQEKVANNLSGVMRSHPDLRFSLAQSIEPILSKEESYAKKPKKVVVSTFHNIAMKLQSEPNFAGIIVQSLDDYLNGALNED